MELGRKRRSECVENDEPAQKRQCREVGVKGGDVAWAVFPPTGGGGGGGDTAAHAKQIKASSPCLPAIVYDTPLTNMEKRWLTKDTQGGRGRKEEQSELSQSEVCLDKPKRGEVCSDKLFRMRHGGRDVVVRDDGLFSATSTLALGSGGLPEMTLRNAQLPTGWQKITGSECTWRRGATIHEESTVNNPLAHQYRTQVFAVDNVEVVQEDSQRRDVHTPLVCKRRFVQGMFPPCYTVGAAKRHTSMDAELTEGHYLFLSTDEYDTVASGIFSTFYWKGWSPHAVVQYTAYETLATFDELRQERVACGLAKPQPAKAANAPRRRTCTNASAALPQEITLVHQICERLGRIIENPIRYVAPKSKSKVATTTTVASATPATSRLHGGSRWVISARDLDWVVNHRGPQPVRSIEGSMSWLVHAFNVVMLTSLTWLAQVGDLGGCVWYDGFWRNIFLKMFESSGGQRGEGPLYRPSSRYWSTTIHSRECVAEPEERQRNDAGLPPDAFDHWVYHVEPSNDADCHDWVWDDVTQRWKTDTKLDETFHLCITKPPFLVKFGDGEFACFPRMPFNDGSRRLVMNHEHFKGRWNACGLMGGYRNVRRGYDEHLLIAEGCKLAKKLGIYEFTVLPRIVSMQPEEAWRLDANTRRPFSSTECSTLTAREILRSSVFDAWRVWDAKGHRPPAEQGDIIAHVDV